MISTVFSLYARSTFTVFLYLINLCYYVIGLVHIACFCATNIKASVALFKYPILSNPHQSSLALRVVYLINCPCIFFGSSVFSFHSFSSFGTPLVFLSLDLILLYVKQLTISLCCFLNNFFTPKLVSPQYLGFQPFLCHVQFLIDAISLHYF